MSEIAATATQSNSLLAFHRKMLRDKPLGGAGGIIFALFLFCGVFADFLAPYGMNETDMRRVLESPSLTHWMGTDHIGRDVFSRILYGAQLSVIIGFLAAGLATIISIILGVLTGYFGGKADMLIQRFVDAWMTFPDLVLLIVVVCWSRRNPDNTHSRVPLRNSGIADHSRFYHCCARKHVYACSSINGR